MSSRRRADNRSIKRRGPTRKPKQRILVVCEGEVTEPKYLRALQHHARNPRLHIEVATEAGAPLTVVQIAARHKANAARQAGLQNDQYLLWDQVWGVFDIDEHPKLAEARHLAEAEGIELAVSNPCFELWALLHFQDQHAHIERHHLRVALQHHLPRYVKELPFDRLHPTYAQAVTRARELDRQAELGGTAGRNPSTGVYLLTEAILKL